MVATEHLFLTSRDSRVPPADVDAVRDVFGGLRLRLLICGSLDAEAGKRVYGNDTETPTGEALI